VDNMDRLVRKKNSFQNYITSTMFSLNMYNFAAGTLTHTKEVATMRRT